MNDPLFVSKMDGVGQRLDQPGGLGRRLGQAPQTVRQVAPRYVFQDQVWLGPYSVPGRQFSEFVDLHQVWVSESGNGPCLLQKSFVSRRVGAMGVAQDLDRHVAV